MNLKELMNLSAQTPRWYLCKPTRREYGKAIETSVTEEVGIPCIKVDTPHLQPGEKVRVIIIKEDK